MSEQETLETVTARLEEVGEIVKGLEHLDKELRQAAGSNLGKVEQTAYVGLTAQATLIATLRQTLKVRMEMLQKAQGELQPQPPRYPRRVDEDEDAG